MNTRISYMYRDANNYKASRDIVLVGGLTKTEIDAIRNKCDWFDGEPKFIASEVGLPSPQDDMRKYGFPTDDDHVWCELLSLCITADEPTKEIKLTAAQLLAAFKKATWDIVAAMKELGWNPMTL